MDRSTAEAIWRALEEARETEYEGDPPTYDVRLDAASASDDRTLGVPPPRSRYYRVRVTGARGMGGMTRDAMQYVLDVARENDVEEVDVDNSALVLT